MKRTNGYLMDNNVKVINILNKLAKTYEVKYRKFALNTLNVEITADEKDWARIEKTLAPIV